MTRPHDHRSTSPTAPGAGRFRLESLDAYQVAREVVAFVAQHRRRRHGLPGEAGPQLARACVRALLDTAEAAGRQGVRDRARVPALARGEACEAAAALDVAVLCGALTSAAAAPARTLLVRLGQMLTRLARPPWRTSNGVSRPARSTTWRRCACATTCRQLWIAPCG